MSKGLQKMSTPIQDPIEKRVAMINGHFYLPSETVESMNEVRDAVDTCARTLHAIFKKQKTDMGRAITSGEEYRMRCTHFATCELRNNKLFECNRVLFQNHFVILR